MKIWPKVIAEARLWAAALVVFFVLLAGLIQAGCWVLRAWVSRAVIRRHRLGADVDPPAGRERLPTCTPRARRWRSLPLNTMWRSEPSGGRFNPPKSQRKRRQGMRGK